MVIAFMCQVLIFKWIFSKYLRDATPFNNPTSIPYGEYLHSSNVYLWLFATHYLANPILSHKKFEFKIKFNLVLGYQISAFAASGLLTNLNGKGKKDRGYSYWVWGFRLFEVLFQFLAFCKLTSVYFGHLVCHIKF